MIGRHAGHEPRRRAAIGRHAGDESGQMAVELVVLIPVVLIVAAIAANLLGYMGECNRFDRICAEAVRVNGVSPGYGEYGKSACERRIEQAVDEAFDGRDFIDVTVTSEDIGVLSGKNREGAGLVFSLEPRLRVYRCTMEYVPPFFGSGVFGFGFPNLVHENEYVVDPYEPTGWM